MEFHHLPVLVVAMSVLLLNYVEPCRTSDDGLIQMKIKDNIKPSCNSCGVHPSDPKFLIGSLFNMSCVVRRKYLKAHSMTMDSVYFEIFPSDRERPPFRIFSNSSSVSVLRESSGKLPNKVVLTYLADDSLLRRTYVNCMLQLNETHTTCVDGTTLEIGYPPAEGYIREVVTQDLQHIEISFDKKSRNIYYMTNFSIIIRINGVEYMCHPPPRVNDSCTFDLRNTNLQDPGKTNIQLELQVFSNHSSSQYTQLGDVKKIRLFEVYKPKAVTSLRIAQYNESNQSALIAWQSASVPVVMMFFILYQSELDPEPLVKTLPLVKDFSEDPLNVSLTGLRYGVTYSIKVFGRPLVGGFNGTQQSITLTTAEAAPSRYPKITEGGFERVMNDDGTQDIVVYWEPVPPIYANGKITRLRILLVGDGRRYLDVPDASATQWRISRLDPTKSYHVAVEAGTSKAYTQHDSDMMIRISALERALTIPHNFTAITNGNSSHVELSWVYSHDMSEGNLTFHWCEGKHENIGKCGSSNIRHYRSQPATPNYTGAELSLDKSADEYVFGISVDSTYDSSGIHWSQCTHDKSKVSSPPVGNELVHTKTTSSITLSLRKPPCSSERGFIYAYKVEIQVIENGKGNDVWRSLFFRNTSLDEYTITDLKQDTNYSLHIYSLTYAGQSVTSLCITASTDKLLIGIYVGIIFGALAFIAAVVVITFKGLQWRKKKIPITVHGDEVPVDQPSRQEPVGDDDNNLSDGYAKVITAEKPEDKHSIACPPPRSTKTPVLDLDALDSHEESDTDQEPESRSVAEISSPVVDREPHHPIHTSHPRRSSPVGQPSDPAQVNVAMCGNPRGNISDRGQQPGEDIHAPHPGVSTTQSGMSTAHSSIDPYNKATIRHSIDPPWVNCSNVTSVPSNGTSLGLEMDLYSAGVSLQSRDDGGDDDLEQPAEVETDMSDVVGPLNDNDGYCKSQVIAAPTGHPAGPPNDTHRLSSRRNAALKVDRSDSGIHMDSPPVIAQGGGMPLPSQNCELQLQEHSSLLSDRDSSDESECDIDGSTGGFVLNHPSTPLVNPRGDRQLTHTQDQDYDPYKHGRVIDTWHR